MGSGSSGATRYGGGGGLNPADIKDTSDLIAERNNKTSEVDAVLTVSRDLMDEYGDAGLNQFVLADIGGKGASTMAYYDGTNIGFNKAYFNDASMTKAYEDCVKSGFHPSNGDKSAMEAVAAHEYGHAITDLVGKKMGVSNLDAAATRIMNEARKAQGKHKGVVQMARKISTYATHSNAESIAEAMADWYCNGNKATAESRAIINVINGYLK